MNWSQEIIKEGNEILNQIDFEISTPAKDDVLNFLKVKPSDIKVVLIGQDPYPTKDVANGYAFAVNKGCRIPQSLNNIFKEINEVQGYVDTDETLESWKDQGVLLLNTALTTEVGNPNAHKKLWQPYTMKVIKFLDENFKDIKWILWGKEAEKVGKNIKGHKVIDFHPSPLSVRHRKKNTFKELSFIKW